MEQVAQLYADHPFWLWLALGVALLAAEAALGTEWLLWPAVAAGVVSVLTLTGLPLGITGEVVAFGALTLVFTLVSRRFFARPPAGADINDARRLVGGQGRAVADFAGGRGRVLVEGTEWPADGPDDLVSGDRVIVEALEGSRLKVRSA